MIPANPVNGAPGERQPSTVFLQPCHLAEGLDAVSTQQRPGPACVCPHHSVARGALGVGAR